MAISKIIYKSSSSAQGETWMDLTQDTVTAGTLMSPETAHGADGEPITGTATGGGGSSAEAKDVNFYDYDGTLLHSYTAVEAAALDALPANPSHTGLTAQGWNWTLAQIKSQLTNVPGGVVNVGQMYVTDDGKTRIYISIPEGTTGVGLTFYVRFTQTKANGVTVDWGDGTTAETYSGTSASNRTHTYTAAGDYTITLIATDGTYSFFGSSSYAIYGSTSTYYNRTRIHKVEVGNNVTSLGDYAFYYCYALESVTIPSSVTRIGDYAFGNCYALKSATIPSGVTSIGTYAFSYCYALESVTIPSGVTSIGSYAFYNCYLLEFITIPNSVTSIGTNAFRSCNALESVTIPSGVTSIGTYAFYYCFALKSITIPSSVTSIGNYAFSNCYLLESITIPSGVTSIGNYAFQYCYALGEIHFKPTTPPTVSNSNAWTGIPTYCKIYVPAGKLSAYTSATNYPSPSIYTYVEEST